MIHLFIVLHQRSLKIHSAPIRRNPQRSSVTTPLRAFCRGTENWIFHPKATRKKCSAGQRAPSSRMKYWKPCAKLIEKAGTSWWACPMPAVSGDAARARSAPFVKEPSYLTDTDAEKTCTLNLSPPHLNWSGGRFLSRCPSVTCFCIFYLKWKGCDCFLLKVICNEQPGLFNLELCFSVPS